MYNSILIIEINGECKEIYCRLLFSQNMISIPVVTILNSFPVPIPTPLVRQFHLAHAGNKYCTIT